MGCQQVKTSALCKPHGCLENSGLSQERACQCGAASGEQWTKSMVNSIHRQQASRKLLAATAQKRFLTLMCGRNWWVGRENMRFASTSSSCWASWVVWKLVVAPGQGIRQIATTLEPNFGRSSHLRFLTAQRAENVIEAIGMLQHLLESTPRGIYWAYLCARARALNLPRQTPET